MSRQAAYDQAMTAWLYIRATPEEAAAIDRLALETGHVQADGRANRSAYVRAVLEAAASALSGLNADRVEQVRQLGWRLRRAMGEAGLPTVAVDIGEALADLLRDLGAAPGSTDAVKVGGRLAPGGPAVSQSLRPAPAAPVFGKDSKGRPYRRRKPAVSISAMAPPRLIAALKTAAAASAMRPGPALLALVFGERLPAPVDLLLAGFLGKLAGSAAQIMTLEPGRADVALGRVRERARQAQRIVLDRHTAQRDKRRRLRNQKPPPDAVGADGQEATQ